MALTAEKVSERTCLACGGPDFNTSRLTRYYGSGSSKWFHPVCVGSWLTMHPDDSLCFEPGEVGKDA